MTQPDTQPTSPRTVDCEVCVVGAGIAGLNAAFVASEYLRPDERIVVVDRHEQAGGMWNDTYDYVRLHQPHPVFTVGNIKWTLGREPSYLAAKEEVGAHLRHCLDVISRRVQVEPLWGSEYVAHTEADGRVDVTVRDLGTGATTVVRAGKLIKATSFDVETLATLPVSSGRVRSVSPNFPDVSGAELRTSREPVWIVGSGKTAMDTAHLLISDDPRREVNLITGSGTWYFARDRLYPTGWRRWVSGVRPNAALGDLARRFDGTNEDEMLHQVLPRIGLAPLDDAVHNYYGLLSASEVATIRSGVTEIVRHHLVDVVDEDGAPQLLLRSGTTRPVEPGSWLVNCTGYLVDRPYAPEPYTSSQGTVLTITGSSLVMLFSSFSAYFLTHLMFLGKLDRVPLYTADLYELKRKTGPAFTFAIATLMQYNLGVIFQAVPAKVFQQCGLDFDLWYPLPRRLVGQVNFIRAQKQQRAHYLATLENLSERFGVRIEPLTQEPSVRSSI